MKTNSRLYPETPLHYTELAVFNDKRIGNIFVFQQGGRLYIIAEDTDLGVINYPNTGRVFHDGYVEVSISAEYANVHNDNLSEMRIFIEITQSNDDGNGSELMIEVQATRETALSIIHCEYI